MSERLERHGLIKGGRKMENQKILDVLNSLNVIEKQGGEDAYILIKNNGENQKLLNDVGVDSETINKYGDEEAFCALSLAFGEGYADFYLDGKFIKFDRSVEIDVEDETVLLFKQNEDYFLVVDHHDGTVSKVKLTESQIREIKEFFV